MRGSVHIHRSTTPALVTCSTSGISTFYHCFSLPFGSGGGWLGEMGVVGDLKISLVTSSLSGTKFNIEEYLVGLLYIGITALTSLNHYSRGS